MENFKSHKREIFWYNIHVPRERSSTLFDIGGRHPAPAIGPKPVWADGKTLCVPRCREGHRMDLCVIRSYDDLEKGAYGILEPKAGCPLVSAAEIGFAVIPCVSFDRRGGRLGQGGGYYDRFLDDLTCHTFLVCRERLVVDRVPCEAHDRRCTYLVTENGVFSPEV